MKRSATRLAAMVVIPLALAGCGSSSKKAATGTGSGGATATTVSSGGGGAYGYGGGGAATTMAPTTTVASGGGTGATSISVTDLGGKLGKVLVGSNGHTLYMFEKDKGTTSACTGGCIGAWPPYVSPNKPSAGAGVTASKLTTVTGAMANQVSYDGHLLYEFSGDTKAGQANGATIPSWYPMSPTGEAAGGS